MTIPADQVQKLMKDCAVGPLLAAANDMEDGCYSGEMTREAIAMWLRQLACEAAEDAQLFGGTG